MEKFQGIAVSPGVALGEALVLDNQGFRIPRRFVQHDAVEQEVQRLHQAIQATRQQIARNRDAINQQLGPHYGAIFDAHLQMLQDEKLLREIEQLVRRRHFSPEYAVSRVLRRYARVFEQLPGPFAEKATDIFDIQRRLLRELLGRDRQELGHLTSPVLVLAHSLTPSEVAGFDPQYVKGFVTEVGGPGSHTAIVAQGLEIPAVVGTGPFLTAVSGGEEVILDADQGWVILDPDEATRQEYQQRIRRRERWLVELRSLDQQEARTADGVRIELMGNIELPQEAEHCRRRGADGIGLYRTEFLYLQSPTPPSEEEHYQAYAQVVQAMQGRVVVIRTFDLGADKLRHLPEPEEQANPFLGLRSLRLALRHTEMFRTQLRAIVRAAALGPVRVLFPFVSTLRELRQAKTVLADVVEDLQEQGQGPPEPVPVGMMIEIPSAAILADLFVPEVDFVSIGTNDLTQYTLAADRGNREVSSLYNPCDPAVLRLLKNTIEQADRHGKPVNVCGQVGSMPECVILLLGLGLRRLSVAPGAIAQVKRICRRVTLPQCQQVAQRALGMDDGRTVQLFLRQEIKQLDGETLV